MDEFVERARAKFRKEHISPSYSGRLHLAVTLVVTLSVITASLWFLQEPTWLEWLTVPITFAYANLSEYLGHRGPMHNPTKLLALIYKRHAIEHHSFFTDTEDTIETPDDFKAVMFPPIMLLFFFGAFATPVAVLIYFILGLNVALLFAFTATGYFLIYEMLHLCYHLDKNSWPTKLPFVALLRRHHTVHHNRDLMARYNFNITFPICDALFGTTYKPNEVKKEIAKT